MTRAFQFISLFFIFGCNAKKQARNLPVDKFKIPFVVQADITDTTNNFIEENISSVFPEFIGQFKFSDTIRFTGERQRRDSISEKQYNWEHQVFEFDTLSSDGLQIFTDYNTSIIYSKTFNRKLFNYYPVYIVNETSTPKLFVGKDSYAFGIQEATDTSHYRRWHPIECRGFDFCGNGYFKRKIEPKEFIMVLFPKYAGNEITHLRVRLKIAENIFISKPFIGRINKKQFDLKKDSWEFSYLKKTKGIGYDGIFYGAIPKNLDKF